MDCWVQFFFGVQFLVLPALFHVDNSVVVEGRIVALRLYIIEPATHLVLRNDHSLPSPLATSSISLAAMPDKCAYVIGTVTWCKE